MTSKEICHKEKMKTMRRKWGGGGRVVGRQTDEKALLSENPLEVKEEIFYDIQNLSAERS